MLDILFAFDNPERALLWRTRAANSLSLLVGGALALASAFLLVKQSWILAIPIAMLIPVGILFLRYPFAAVALYLLLFPLVVETPFAAVRPIQWILHRAMFPGAFVLIALGIRFGLIRKKPLRLGAAELFMFLYLLLSIVNILLMSEPPLRGLIRYYDRIIIPFSVYLFIRLFQPEEKDIKRLVGVALIAIVIQLIIGLLSWTNPGLLPEAWLGRLGERTTGSLGIPGIYTTTLIFLGLLVLQYALQTRSFLWRIAGLATLTLVSLGVLFTFSRGSWLGAIVVLAGLTLLYPRTLLRLLLVLSFLLALLGGTVFNDELAFAYQRLTKEETAQGRIVGGAATLRLIQQRPFFGWGYGNHERYDEQFRTRVFGIPIRNEQTSHHTYLLIAAEMGLVGLFLYMLPAAWWLYRSIRVWSRLPRDGFSGRTWLSMLWLVLIAHFIIGNFTEMIFSFYFSTTMWWFILGLIAVIVTRAKRQAHEPALATVGLSRLLG